MAESAWCYRLNPLYKVGDTVPFLHNKQITKMTVISIEYNSIGEHKYKLKKESRSCLKYTIPERKH